MWGVVLGACDAFSCMHAYMPWEAPDGERDGALLASMVATCLQMLDTPDTDSAVRIGDVFAELIQYYNEVSYNTP